MSHAMASIADHQSEVLHSSYLCFVMSGLEESLHMDSQ